jgi:hypothetical protein
MTLRQALDDDPARLHKLLEELLDREDVVVLLFDGDRAVNYINGFGLSPSQHELMALEIERMVRAAGGIGASEARGRRNRREQGSDSGGGARVRERLGSAAGRRESRLVGGGSPSVGSDHAAHGGRGFASRPVLRLARTPDTRRAD